MGDIWHRNHLLSPSDINSINVIKKISREFLAKLQKLAKTREFGNYWNEALTDRLVCGVNSKATIRKLLGEAELSLKKAVDIVVGMELTDKEINQFSNDKQVNKVESQECFRCGKKNHSPDKCFHKNSECHICKKKGHISPKCPEKGKGATSKEDSTKSAIQNKPKSKKSKDAKFKKKKRNSKIKFVDTQEEVSSDTEVSSDKEENSHSDWPMFTASSSRLNKVMLCFVYVITLLKEKSRCNCGITEY